MPSSWYRRLTFRSQWIQSRMRPRWPSPWSMRHTGQILLLLLVVWLLAPQTSTAHGSTGFESRLNSSVYLVFVKKSQNSPDREDINPVFLSYHVHVWVPYIAAKDSKLWCPGQDHQHENGRWAGFQRGKHDHEEGGQVESQGHRHEGRRPCDNWDGRWVQVPAHGQESSAGRLEAYEREGIRDSGDRGLRAPLGHQSEGSEDDADQGWDHDQVDWARGQACLSARIWR